MNGKRAKNMILAALGLAVVAAGAVAAAGAAGAMTGPEQAPRRFLLLIDLRQNDVAGIGMSKIAALYFLESAVRDGDEAAFLTFSEIRGLQVREDLTPDRERIRKAIQSLAEVPGIPDEDLWSTPLSTHNFLEETGDFAQDLGGVPGTKNVVFFTSGFPVYAYQADRTFRDLYDKMSLRFKESQAPVFVVNALGHRADWQAIEEKSDFVLKKLAAISGGRYFRDVTQYRSIAQEIGKLAGD
jgi:hypothetical protein